MLPILLIFVYAFTTEEKSYQWPPPGLTLAMVRRHLEPARRLAGADAVGAGRGDLDGDRAGPRHALRRRRQPDEILRPRDDLAAGHPADRAARHHHRHRAALGLLAGRDPVLVLDDHPRPRHLLRGRRLQQRRRPLPPRLRLAGRGLDGSRRRRVPDLPPRHPAQHRHGAAGRRHARLRAVLRRGHRHHLHRRPAADAADLDARGTGAAAPAPGHQCRRHGRRAGDAAADPRRLSTSPATATRSPVPANENASRREPHGHQDADRLEIRGRNRRPRSRCSIRGPGRRSSTCPRPRTAQIDAAVAAAEKAFATWSRTTPGAALRLSAEDRRAHRGRCRGVRGARGAELRQADQRGAATTRSRRSSTAGASSPARCAPCPASGRRRISARPHLDDPPRPDRHRRLDRAVELSADDDGLEAGAGDRAAATRSSSSRPSRRR